MANPPTNRAAGQDRADRVLALFKCVLTEKRFSKAWSGGRDIKPSWQNLALFFRFSNTEFSNWKLGHDRRKKENETNVRLLEIVRGQAVTDDPGLAGEIYRFWIEKVGEEYLVALAADLMQHGQSLEQLAIDEEQQRHVAAVRTVDTNPGAAFPATAAFPAAESAAGRAPENAPGRSYSAAWTQRQAKRSAELLLNGDERAIYLCGAPNSGKSWLIAALVELWGQARPQPRVAVLELGEFVNAFAARSDQREICQMVVGRLRAELGSDDADYTVAAFPDFKRELGKALACGGDEPILLIIANADNALRRRDPAVRDAGIRGTGQLYASLKTIVEANAERPFSRVSLLLEGSRPVDDLVDAYGDDVSPFSDARLWKMPRLTADECMELAEAAGFTEETTRRRLFEETAGHRSLFWSLLRELNPAQQLPQDLSDLPRLIRHVAKLWEELRLQPRLSEALGKLLSHERITLDDRTRLKLMNLVDDGDPPKCSCPLMERMLSLGLKTAVAS